MSFEDPTPAPAGGRALTGGQIAAFIGILLLVFGPSPSLGSPVNPHKLAWIFVGVGAFLLAIGIFARLFFRD